MIANGECVEAEWALGSKTMGLQCHSSRGPRSKLDRSSESRAQLVTQTMEWEEY